MMTPKIFSCAFLLACFLGTSANVWAIEVGAKVEFVRAGQKISGTVVGVRAGGKFAEVEAMHAGQTHKIIVLADSLTEVAMPSSGGARTWRDASGKFEIEATLHAQSAFEVTLKKQDGSLIKVPLSKLSADDQEYVASIETTNENPFAGGSSGSNAMSGDAASGSGGSLRMPPAATFRSSTTVLMKTESAPSNYSPDPSSIDLSQIDNAAMPVPEVPNGARLARPLFISPDGTTLCFQARNGERRTQSDSDRYTQIHLIDGKKRSTNMVGEIKGESIWLCSGDPVSGNVLGAVMKHGDEKSNSLCVIEGIANGSPRIAAHWRLFKDADKADYVVYRKILPNGMVLVCCAGKLRAYDYKRQQEVWTSDMAAFSEPAVSPGGKYAAVYADRGVMIVETQSGKVLGGIPVGFIGAVCLGFNSDATQLAVASGQEVRIFDVATAQQVYSHEANTSLASHGKPVFWVGENQLLLPSGILLDSEQDLILWKYNITNDGVDFTDVEHHGLLAFEGSKRFAIVRLPHAAALNAAPGNNSNLVAIGPGDPISIVFQGGDFSADSRKIEAAMRKAIENSGYRVTQNAQNQMFISITRGKPRTETYRTIGYGGSESVTFTPVTSKVELKQAGKTIWQRSTTSGLPYFLHDDSLENAARRAEKPNVGFFENMKLPKQLLKPEYQQGFGSSIVSALGIAG